MPYAMSTLNQGGTPFIQIPTWAMNPNASTGLTFIELDFILHAPDAGNGLGYILGNSASSTFSISVSVTNALRYVHGSSERILSADNTFVYGQRCILRVEYNDTGVSATAWTRMYLNGIPVGSDWVGSTQTISINQAGRYSTTRHSPMTIYGLRFGSSNPAAIGYEANWGPQGASGASVNWADDTSTRNLTISGHTGAANSWWLFYSNFYVGEGTISVSATGLAELASSKVGNASVSAVAAALAACQGSKTGSAVLSLPITAGILLSASKNTSASITMPINAVMGIAANKVGVAPLYVEAAADISLYAGNIVIGEGTFSVTAMAQASVQGEKVGHSQVHFAAAAAVYSSAVKQGAAGVTASANAAVVAQALKTGQATPQLAAAVALSADGYKLGLGSFAVLASATISLSGSNPAAVPAPVALLFVRSSSRYTHSMRTSGRYSYYLKTSSGGARV